MNVQRGSSFSESAAGGHHPAASSGGLLDGDVDVRRQHVVDDEHRERTTHREARQDAQREDYVPGHVGPHDGDERADRIERVELRSDSRRELGVPVGLIPRLSNRSLVRPAHGKKRQGNLNLALLPVVLRRVIQRAPVALAARVEDVAKVHRGEVDGDAVFAAAEKRGVLGHGRSVFLILRVHLHLRIARELAVGSSLYEPHQIVAHAGERQDGLADVIVGSDEVAIVRRHTELRLGDRDGEPVYDAVVEASLAVGREVVRVRLLHLSEPSLLVVETHESHLEEEVVVAADVLDDHLASAPDDDTELDVNDRGRRDLHRPRHVLISLVHLHPELERTLAASRVVVQQRAKLEWRRLGELALPNRREPSVLEVHRVDADDVVAAVFVPVVQLKLQLGRTRELGGELEHLVEPGRQGLLHVVAPVAKPLARAEKVNLHVRVAETAGV
mmetsp:Transcript_12738/g.51161  ORF Transcript_12738/g.51161 Transcript_12738/m.51161 type:complete len:445 (-) Transcript_12738:437-1771(-)